ncbi:MAG: hypothetical protein V4679_00615 [Pseudomonadota bacterium]
MLLTILSLALVLGYAIAVRLPPSAGWENSWIENSQVLVLLGGGLMAVQFARASRRDGLPSTIRAFSLICMPTWFLMGARELSWGAALGAPVVVMPDGPFYSSSVLWYHEAIRPLVAVFALCALGFAARLRLDRMLWRIVRTGNFPSAEFTILLLAALGSTYADGHLFGLPILQTLHGHEIVLEEWMELVGYLALLMGQRHVFAALNGLREE